MPSILIVCSANMCRSPMGEAILKQLVASRSDASEWRIESAGAWTDNGFPPTPLAQIVMQKRGLNITSHCSQRADKNLIKQFDLILTMEAHQKEGLQVAFKKYSDRIYMISEMLDVVEDIDDPVGGDLEDYTETAEKLERILSGGLDKIYQLATASRKSREH